VAGNAAEWLNFVQFNRKIQRPGGWQQQILHRGALASKNPDSAKKVFTLFAGHTEVDSRRRAQLASCPRLAGMDRYF
jgi:hypothetical protein